MVLQQYPRITSGVSVSIIMYFYMSFIEEIAYYEYVLYGDTKI